jgi:hypothetical protein
MAKSTSKKSAAESIDWHRVEDLLAEKLADRVKINLKIRETESDSEVEEDDGVDEGDFTQDEIDEEISSRDLFKCFKDRQFIKTNRVG